MTRLTHTFARTDSPSSPRRAEGSSRPQPVKARRLSAARRIVRQVNRTNDEILAACAVLKAYGDYCDHMMADHLCRVIEAEQQMIEAKPTNAKEDQK